MQKFWNWLVYSSADPDRLATTVKGFLIGVLPLAVMFLGLTHANLGQAQLTALVDDIALVVKYAMGLVSVVITVSGLVRKIITTINGTNAVLNQSSSSMDAQ